MCQQYPGIDGKFAVVMAEHLKSDSNVAMDGDAGLSKGGNKSSSSRSEKLLVSKMEEATRATVESNNRAYEQRKEYIDLQKAELAKNSAQADWKDYFDLCKVFNGTRKENDDNNASILRNMAFCLKQLEDCLGIPISRTVTAGFYVED
jgi:hypothetical protein